LLDGRTIESLNIFFCFCIADFSHIFIWAFKPIIIIIIIISNVGFPRRLEGSRHPKRQENQLKYIR